METTRSETPAQIPTAAKLCSARSHSSLGLIFRIRKGLIAATLPCAIAILSGVVAHAAVPPGAPYAFGENSYGQIGNGAAGVAQPLTQVGAPGTDGAPPWLSGVIALAGANHSLALRKDGTVWTWGSNNHGQLGNGTTTRALYPVQVVGLTNVKAIATGVDHSLALKSDGTVWAWGSNYRGQLGDGSVTARTTPVQVTGLSGISAIAAGSGFSMALKSDGSVWECGDGSNTQVATRVAISDPVKAIAAGGYHRVALLNNGEVWTWGNNQSGQLGDGTTVNYRNTPARGPGILAAAISAGGFFTLALGTNGRLYAWGEGTFGQLGQGNTTDSRYPVLVSGPTNITHIVAGGAHSFVTTADGTVWGWGHDSYGQLGDGQTTHQLVPKTIPQLKGLTLFPGGLHTLALGPAYRVSGRVSVPYGTPLSEVRITCSGTDVPVFTNSAGYYTIPDVPPGTYTLTPTRTGYSFIPASRQVTVTTADLPTVNFGTYASFTASGRVTTSSGAGMSGVTLLRSGAPANSPAVVTGSNGNYSIADLALGNYTMTPMINGCSFVPAVQTVSQSSPVANFTILFSIVGRIANGSGVGLANASVALSPATNGVTSPVATDSNGNYRFERVPVGSYTVTPKLAGVVFSPATQALNVTQAPRGANFVGTAYFKVSGRVATSSGLPIAGATVTLSGRGSLLTNGAGYYTFTNVPAGHYTITPAQDGKSFTPATKSIAVGTSDLSGVNFTGM